MQKAQRIIKTYRRNRMIVCTICALFTLVATLSVRFISQRNLNQQRVILFANHAVEELDKVLQPLQEGRELLLPLIGLPAQSLICLYASRPQNCKPCVLLVWFKTVRSIAPVFLAIEMSLFMIFKPICLPHGLFCVFPPIAC